MSGSNISGPSSRPQSQAALQHPHSWGSERAPSVDSAGRSTHRPLFTVGGLLYEETQCSADNYITPEQWRSARNRCFTQAANPPPSVVSPADAHLYVREERDDRADLALKNPSAPPPPASACGMFRSPCGASPSGTLDAGLNIDRTINYVNIPISLLLAKTTRELLHSELDLQESSSAPVSSLHRGVKEEGSLRYAHLDIAAMGTAQRVGAEPDQDNKDTLTQQENRRRGHRAECND
ncbi:unnamed protein product [Pleuronectes platessa]|uniref:Uncharacterized protein n=1 Tax=Pleuronectes platessa TaxID=8262 RepID=A0A9N7TQ80_PLEPL|nr:unnamed protein product [Pleuronectes platessa]